MQYHLSASLCVRSSQTTLSAQHRREIVFLVRASRLTSYRSYTLCLPAVYLSALQSHQDNRLPSALADWHFYFRILHGTGLRLVVLATPETQTRRVGCTPPTPVQPRVLSLPAQKQKLPLSSAEKLSAAQGEGGEKGLSRQRLPPIRLSCLVVWNFRWHQKLFYFPLVWWQRKGGPFW